MARSPNLDLVNDAARSRRQGAASSPNLLHCICRLLGTERDRMRPSLAIEFRCADDHLDRVPALAEDLVRRQVNVMVAAGGSVAKAAKAATASSTNSIPSIGCSVMTACPAHSTAIGLSALGNTSPTPAISW
jgi:hypothetical protein